MNDYNACADTERAYIELMNNDELRARVLTTDNIDKIRVLHVTDDKLNERAFVDYVTFNVDMGYSNFVVSYCPTEQFKEHRVFIIGDGTDEFNLPRDSRLAWHLDVIVRKIEEHLD